MSKILQNFKLFYIFKTPTARIIPNQVKYATKALVTAETSKFKPKQTASMSAWGVNRLFSSTKIQMKEGGGGVCKKTPPPVCADDKSAEKSEVSCGGSPGTGKGSTCDKGSSGGDQGQGGGTESRIQRQEPGKVILGFVPVEWPEFFVPKTGYSGFWIFWFTFGTYLVSKEIYVLEHEYYNGISMAIMWYYGVTRLGPDIAKTLDKEVDDYEKEMNAGRIAQRQNIENQVKQEVENQFVMEGQTILVEAKRENVLLQLEDEFRKRQMNVYNTITNMLDYHVAVEEVHEKIAHKNLVDWVKREVQKSITPELQEQFLNFCIEDIEKLIKETK